MQQALECAKTLVELARLWWPENSTTGREQLIQVRERLNSPLLLACTTAQLGRISRVSLKGRSDNGNPLGMRCTPMFNSCDIV